jgi:hypothetical protein
MHATHLHPRRAFLAAAAALGLALAALTPAALDDASFSLGATDRGAAAPVSAPAAQNPRSEPVWNDNPFAHPLLQAPGK